MKQAIKTYKWYLVILILIIGIGWLLINLILARQQVDTSPLPSPTELAAPPVSEPPQPLGIYSPPALPLKEAYTIIMVGDSMIKSLGPDSNRLREYLKNYYPQTVFGIFNYGFAATNLLSLDQRLHNDTIAEGVAYPAILNRQFDVLIIESFGHNPLSQFSLSEGLQEQSLVLEQTVIQVSQSHPESVVVFMAVMAPSQQNYGQGVLDLEPPARAQWATERMAYIENHIQFAQNHGIPLINIYEQTLENGDGNLRYLSQDDFIHPSADGVELISEQIADFLYTHKIVPIESR